MHTMRRCHCCIESSDESFSPCQQAVLGSHMTGTLIGPLLGQQAENALALCESCALLHWPCCTTTLHASCALSLGAYCPLAFRASCALTLYASMCCGTSASQSWAACSYRPRPQQTCLAAMLSCHVCLCATPLASLLLLGAREVFLPAPVYQMKSICQILLPASRGRQWVSPVGLLVHWQAKQLPMGADTMTAVQLLHRSRP